MKEVEVIILIVWLVGIVFNIFTAKYLFPEDEEPDGFFAILLLPLLMIMWFFKGMFILGSWMSWIAVGFVWTGGKIRDIWERRIRNGSN